MKDRPVSIISPRSGLSLVVVLTAGSLWLAAGSTPQPCVSYVCSAQAAPGVTLAAPGVRGGAAQASRRSPLEERLPGELSEGERVVSAKSPAGETGPVLSAFPFHQQDSAAFSFDPQGPFLPAPFVVQPREAAEQGFPPGLAEVFGVQGPPGPVEAFGRDSVGPPPEVFTFHEFPDNRPAEPDLDAADDDQVSPEVQLSLPPAIEEASRELERALRAEAEQDEQPPEPRPAHDLRTMEQSPVLLPTPPEGPAGRSPHLELMAREADLHTRQGFSLAGRKAYFSARAEFVLALRRVSQALDAEDQTNTHSRALAAGWTAIKEADDFIPTGSQLEAHLDLASIIGGHRTPVLKDASIDRLTPLAALQCYFTFAQEQLAASVGEELAGSMALYGLGNLYRALASQRSPTIRAATPKAMAFYQAALLVTPQNYMASNELGVLLARGGRREDARAALEHSVSIHPHPAGLYNLAVVYRALGQKEPALRAYRQCQALYQAQRSRRGRPAGSSGTAVEWVDPATFARFGAGPSGLARPASADLWSTTWRTWPTKPSPIDRVELAAFDGLTPARPALYTVGIASGTAYEPSWIRLCQALGPAAPCDPCAVDCSCCDWSGRGGWEGARAVAWQAYAQGEYVGHERTAHVRQYRLRVDDLLDLVYRVTRDETTTPYRLNVGDEIRVESFTDKELNRDLIIQPDGTITLRLLGQVHATGRTVSRLRDQLEKLYTKYYPVPAITVTPLKVNTKLEDLRSVVDSRYGRGGQAREAKVTPEGTIALPVLGSVPAQGLTLPELQRELNERYREEIEGIEVIPVLVQRAPRFVYVMGEVKTPGRFELTGPTTVLQALSMAGSWNVGAHLRQIVIFRRGDDWRLMATMVDLRNALNGRQACPAGELWLSDSDVIIVPKSPILRADDFIELVFTRGIYGVLPLQGAVNFSSASTL